MVAHEGLLLRWTAPVSRTAERDQRLELRLQGSVRGALAYPDARVRLRARVRTRVTHGGPAARARTAGSQGALSGACAASSGCLATYASEIGHGGATCSACLPRGVLPRRINHDQCGGPSSCSCSSCRRSWRSPAPRHARWRQAGPDALTARLSQCTVVCAEARSWTRLPTATQALCSTRTLTRGRWWLAASRRRDQRSGGRGAARAAPPAALAASLAASARSDPRPCGYGWRG